MRRLSALVVFSALSLSLAVLPPVEGLKAGEDPLNAVHTFVLHKKKGPTFVGSRSFAGPVPRGEIDRAAPPFPKLSPLAEQWVSQRSPRDRDVFVVTFVDNFEIPRFPEPVPPSRDSAANRAAFARADELVRQIRSARAADYAALTALLQDGFDGRVRSTFWLIRGVVVDLPIGGVTALAQRPDVQFIETNKTDDEPPNSNPNDDVEDGRARIRSDPYLAWGLGGISWIGGIGLIDSGMRFTHQQFSLLNPIKGDCINGGSDCLTGNIVPEDVCDHGTASAGILSGNSFLGSEYHGVTSDPDNGAHVDSWKIFSPNDEGKCTAISEALVLGIENSVKNLDRIIVAEAQAKSGSLGAASTAANEAFDAGSVVIAAIGNYGPAPNTTAAPGSAQRAIGVGAFDVETGAQYAKQSRGPVYDRVKPDIQAPTNTEAASSAGDNFAGVFTGTSGATPYAGGAAYLIRRLLATHNIYDPGNVYSMLILSGDHPYPFDNTSGAGRIRLPVHGYLQVAKIAIAQGQTVEIPIDLSEQKVKAGHVLDASLWWPEQEIQQFPTELHLEIVDKKGSVTAESKDPGSVFQRARTKLSGKASGIWKARVRGFQVELNNLKDPQVAYVCFFLNKKP